MTFDHSKLKGRMREFGFSQERLAKQLGISTVSLNNKLGNKTDFTTKEIRTMMAVLSIENPVPYFFTLSVGNSQM